MNPHPRCHPWRLAPPKSKFLSAREPWDVVAQGLATVPMQLLKTGEFLLEEQQDGDLMQVQFEDVELPGSVLHRFMGLRLRQVP